MDSSQTHPCPAEELLDSYAAGSCGREQAAAIDAHLRCCERCRGWVERAQANEVLVDGVRRAIHRHAQASQRPDSPVPTAAPGQPDGSGPSPSAQQIVGGYEILEEIGRGGMGVVYKARQDSTRRIVALKVMLEGPLASDSARRRFEREIELAASLNHPNIATIHDSGLSRGRYYFAMDYIPGHRLDRYVKDHELPIEARLQLVQKVCLAVNHAHQRGVIHRDLKPSNILVDDRSEPHILDFGLAKTIGSPSAESLLISIGGQVLGTLPYMAPEQASGSCQEADSRTDVYAIGVILYEMLTGRYPYPVAGNIAEVLRNITEAEPQKPSTLLRTIHDDLETIVMKALAKDKDLRYESPGAMAADIGRYLAGEAIEAKQDSAWYVLRKALRRYRWGVSTAAGLMILAVVVAITTTSLYKQARQERQRAEGNARRLSEELLAGTIEQGRALASAGRIDESERLLWQEFLRQPEDLHTAWALRELYSWHPCLATVKAADAPISSVAIGPKGDLAASADTAGGIRVFQVPEFRLLTTIASQSPSVSCLSWTPDGNLLASAGNDGQVALWEMPSGACAKRWTVRTVPLHGSQEPPTDEVAPLQVAISPDGSILACCGAGNRVEIWDCASARIIGSLSGHLGPVASLAFSPDGRLLASASYDKTVRIWEMHGSRCRFILSGHLDPVTSVSFNSDGTLLASGSRDGSVILWDEASGKCLAGLEGHACWVQSITFSRDGGRLASGDIFGRIKIWDLSSGRCRLTIAAHTEGLQNLRTSPVQLAFSPANDLLVSGSRAGIAKLWDLSGNRGMIAIGKHPSRVVSVGATAGGQYWASRDELGTVRLWDASSRQSLTALNALPGQTPVDEDRDSQELASEQQMLAVSGDGRVLACTAPQGKDLLLYEIPSGKLTKTLGPSKDKIQSLCFSPDGQVLASGGTDGHVEIWRISSGKCTAAFGEGLSKAAISCIAFSPDGQRIAYASGHSMTVREVSSGKRVFADDESARIRSITFCPDGQSLALATEDSLKLLPIRQDGPARILRGQAGATYSVAFSPDGRILATADQSHTISLWSVTDGRRLATLPGDGHAAWSLSFSPDGQTLLSAGDSRYIRLWDLAYCDNSVQGNYTYYAALIDPASGESKMTAAGAWNPNKDIETRLHRNPSMATRIAHGSPSTSAVTPEQVEYWGMLTRQSLLDTNRRLSHSSLQLKLPVAGPDDVTATRQLTGNRNAPSPGVAGGPAKPSPQLLDDLTRIAGPYSGAKQAVAPGDVKWQALTNDCIRSSPAIGPDGTVYVGCMDGNLYAFGPDGSRTWQFRTGSAIVSTPAIGTDGTIYIGSCDYKLYAINPDGTGKWDMGTRAPITSSPAVGADGTVYVGSNDRRLYAVDPDGRRKWELAVGGAIHYSSPAIAANGTIYVGSLDGNLYAVDLAGKRLWALHVGDYVCSSPAIAADGTIYVGSQDTVFAADGSFLPGTGDGRFCAINADGTKKWDYQPRGSFASAPAIGADGTIYVASTDGRFCALGPDGSLRWEFQAGGESVAAPAVAADGTIYFASHDHMLYALTTDGSVLWRLDTGSFVASSPVIASDGTVYVGNHGHRLYAIRGAAGPAAGPWPMFRGGLLRSGLQMLPTSTQACEAATTRGTTSSPAGRGPSTEGISRWASRCGGVHWSSPAIGNDGTIYVGSKDRKLYAIDRDGRCRWTFRASDQINSSPAIGIDGTIYVSAIDGNLHAISPEGTPKWDFPTWSKPNDANSGFVSSPTIGSDGTIYIGAARSVYALNTDGSQKWAVPADKVLSPPAIGRDGTIYFGTWDHKICAVGADGSKRWEFATGGNTTAAPAVGPDGAIYIGSGDGYLYAMWPSGELRWKAKTRGAVRTSVAIGPDGTLYVGSNDWSLRALNPDGVPRWEFHTGGVITSSPAVAADGVIYVGSQDGYLYAVNPDGTQRWRFAADGAITSSPTIAADGSIFVGSEAGSIYCLYGTTGPAASAWPMFLQNALHHGRVADCPSLDEQRQ